MKESILEINHSPVPTVTSNQIAKAIWMLTKEYTKVINHSTAPIVPRNSPRKLIWRDIKVIIAHIKIFAVKIVKMIVN